MATKKFTNAPGPTEIGNWQNEIPKVGGTVSGSPDTIATGASQEAIDLYNLDKQQRSLIANSLKKAGYKVPTDGSFGPALLSAYMDALGKAQSMAFTIGQEFDPTTDLSKYLTQAIAEREALGVGGAAGSADFQRRVVYDPTQAASVINTVYSDLLGRQATEKELARYTKMLQKAQRENPVKYTDTAGAGYTATGGIDPNQFLVQQIAGTDEAKAQQVMGYYDTFKKALGVM